MRCPYCASENTQVKDSRPTEEDAAIRRRRICPDCGGRFTTFERVQLRELIVVKRSGRRVPFDRDKLARSIEIALRKRPVAGRAHRADDLRASCASSRAWARARSRPRRSASWSWRGCVPSTPVAYVRFASVYRDFREAADFHEVLGEIAGHPALALGDDDEANEVPAAKAAVDYKQ